MASRRSSRLSAKADLSAMPPPQTSASSQPPTGQTNGRKRKHAPLVSAEEEEASPQTMTAPPVTPPPNKRRTQNAIDATSPTRPRPLATPTPSAVGLMSEHLNGPNLSRKCGKPRPAAVARLADPNTTNALLISPESSRVVSSEPTADTVGAGRTASSPSKTSISPSKPPRLDSTSSLVGTDNHRQPTTTENILEVACAHLIRVDERMRLLVERNHCRVFSAEGLAEEIDPFESLCSGIISQQVSGAAAKSIKAKFVALFDEDKEEGAKQGAANGVDDGNTNAVNGTEIGAGNDEARAAPAEDPPGRRRFPHPSQVASAKIERLRTAGLSQRKAEYVQGLAEKFASGELSARMLAEAPYEEVLQKLIAVRGLGQWSVEMFACFALKRMDVFSLGDLGVQRGMAAFEGRDVAKLKNKGGKWKYMSEKEMLEISERFAPYRSLFMWYMWRVEETDISTLE